MEQAERRKTLNGETGEFSLSEWDRWDRETAVDARLGLLPGALYEARGGGRRHLGEVKEAYREGSTTNLEAIECREDGKYIRGTDARHKTWLRYREEGRQEEFIEEFDVPPDVQEMLGDAL
jgi:hypothetical protein